MPQTLRASIAPLSVAMAVTLVWTPATSRSQEVFSTGFESGLPVEFSAPGSVITPVQGWAGLGPPGRAFDGSFLRYTSVPLHPTNLSLTGLPPHDTVDVLFLLAIIDSWDGTELMKVSVDGVELFSHWFQIATGDTSGYAAPAGALLSSGTNLGFTAGFFYGRDRAYDLGAESAFLGIPHTSSSLVVSWTIGAVSGPAATQWQGGSDESWAIDGISIVVNSLAVDAPALPASGSVGLVLDGTWPNPSRGGAWTVGFALPNTSPATLDLVDVTGRLMAHRAVGGLGVGRHQVEIGRGDRLPAGVYFVRLSQGQETRVTRAVLLR